MDMHCGKDDSERLLLLAVGGMECKQERDGVRSPGYGRADAVAGAKVFAGERKFG
jgi:hypothetical protein